MPLSTLHNFSNVSNFLIILFGWVFSQKTWGNGRQPSVRFGLTLDLLRWLCSIRGLFFAHMLLEMCRTWFDCFLLTSTVCVSKMSQILSGRIKSPSLSPDAFPTLIEFICCIELHHTSITSLGVFVCQPPVLSCSVCVCLAQTWVSLASRAEKQAGVCACVHACVCV